MQFDSKRAYREHLDANHIDELSTDAPIERPHGNKVVSTSG